MLVATIARSKHGTPAHDVAVLDLSREVAIARRMADEALKRYETAVELWDSMTGEQQILSASEGFKPPTAHEVLLAVDVTSKIQAKLAAIEARDSVSIDALLGFMTQVRALVTQFVPDEATQKGLLTAIQSLDIRS